MSQDKKVNLACFCERVEIEPTTDREVFVSLNGVSRDALQYLKEVIRAEEKRLQYLNTRETSKDLYEQETD